MNVSALCLILLKTLLSVARTRGCESIGSLLSCGYDEALYNATAYPNSVPSSIPSATIYLPHIIQVINASCSAQAEHFACAALFPSCSSRGRGPCSSLCLKVRTDCATEFVADLKGAYVVLTDIFDCDRYRSDQCVEPLDIQPSSSSPSSSTSSTTGTTVLPTPSLEPSPGNSSSLNTTGCPPSSRNYFTDGAKSFAVGWTATWSVLSFLSTLLTIFTFLLKPSRFQYPWRPIVYLALCFNVHSIGYLFALILGRRIVTCPGNEYVTTTISWDWDHVPCLLVFGLLYYSMMAAFLWWLVLTLSWFLASALKWSNEAVGNVAPFFHVVSWVLPLLMLVCLVAGRVVSADELTGVCFIVRDDQMPSFYALLIGVILPLIIFLIIGMFFLTVGLISVCRIHSFLRHKGQEKETVVLEKLIIRVGIFVSIYIFPAAVVIGCFFYELDQRPKWNAIEEGCSGNKCNSANSTVFVVRVFMFLIIGILTGVWIWSKKTLDSWKDLASSIRSCCLPPQSPEMGSSMTNMKY